MRLAHIALLFSAVAPGFSATFGTVVTAPSGASYSDLVLDEARGRLYLVNPAGNRVDIYGIAQRNFVARVDTGAQPVSAALSPDGRTLYVTTYTAASLNIIDLTKNPPAISGRISLPAGPEGVAAMSDGRVLISTVGNSGQNVLLIYDPRASSSSNLNNVALAPAAPTPPTLPPPSGRAYLSYHSKLISTNDGNYVIGANVTSGAATNNRVVFVYEVKSGTVLRSRIVTSLSDVLSVSPDGSRFMAGSTLFDTATLSILAQENTANSPFAFPANSNFNTQANQGGSIFSPDGTNIYSAFNFAPVQNPPARANVTRLLYNDPDNLLIKLGLQLPENLSGRMAINTAGTVIYAISESGFIELPVGAVAQSPIAQVESQIVSLVNDQCGVNAAQNAVATNVLNAGRGRLTLSVQPYTLPNTGVAGLGGGGAGGTIVFPVPGGGVIVINAPGGNNNGNQPGFTTSGTTSTVPLYQAVPNANGDTITFKFNSNAAKTLGTAASNDFLVQSPDAINIPANIRVFQNNRDAEARGRIVPVAQNISTGEVLMDLLQDTARQRLYIANSGMNRVEVFDLKTQAFGTPIKVGQLPHSMAFGTDGNTLYVANTGGESISIVDLTKMATVGRVTFPPIPVNVAVALAYPVSIASSLRGPQFVQSDGTIWKVDGTQAIPRFLNPAIFGGSFANPVKTVGGGNPAYRTMAATPEGDFVLLATGAGNVYLYDANIDDFTIGRQIFSTPLTGYLGTVAAGPKGSYYIANNTLLNASLTPTATPPVVGAVGGGALPGVGGTTTTTTRPIAAAAAIGPNQFARFSTPVRAGNNSAVTDAGMIEVVDVTTGNTIRTVNTLEGPVSAVTGTGRATTNPRTLVVDAAGATAYALTATGLSIIPLTPVAVTSRPAVAQNGVVNLASLTTSVATGGLIGIFGQNLADTATATAGVKLPTVLGGTCVTLNNVPLPLSATTPGQINAQLPTTLAAGRYPIVVHSISKQAASVFPVTVTVTKYAPAVFVNNGQASIFDSKGALVTKDNPASRDHDYTIYATGLGATHGGAVVSGAPVPATPPALTDPVQVFFGPQGYSQSPVIVSSSSLVPGMIGVDQIKVRIPGTHMKGDAVPVSIKIGGVSSLTTGALVPTVAVE